MGRKRQRQTEDDNDNNDAVKKPRTFSEKDAKLAKIYGRLADEASEKRAEATKELLQELGPDSKSSKEDLQKAFKRLIRGVCSGRKAARQGFFVALAELLTDVFGSGSKYDAANIPNLKDLITSVEAITTPEGEAVGQERKDYLLGRLFVWKAFVYSGVPDSEKDAELWDEVIHNVLVLFLQVTWLRDECAMVLIEVLENPAGSPERKSRQASAILKGLTEKGLLKTPQGTAIWLVAHETNPAADYPKKIWHKNDPLHQKERQALVAVFKQAGSNGQSAESEGSAPRKSGHWQPTPSLAWTTLVKTINVRSGHLSVEEESRGVDFFAKAWNDLIDSILFSQKASPERKFWGVRIFSDLIGLIPPRLIETLFSPNLVGVLSNQLKDNERYLHEAALSALKKIRSRAEKLPGSSVPLLKGLFSHNLRLLASEKDKKVARLAQDIVTATTTSELRQLTDTIHDFILRPSLKPEEANIPILRQLMTDLLVDLVRDRVKQGTALKSEEDAEIVRLLQRLSRLAYSAISEDEASPEIDSTTRRMFQARLNSILTALCSLDLERAVHYVASAVPLDEYQAGKRLPDPGSLSKAYVLEADQRVWKQIAQASVVLSELAKPPKKAANQQVYLALRLLFYLTILEVHNGDADAVSLLEELELCYESVKDKKKADTKAFDLIIELLLSFLSKSASLYKKMAELVFSACTVGLSQDSLQSMLHILEQQEDLAGQQELFDAQDSVDGDDDVEEIDGDEDEDDEDASDVEMIDGDDAKGLKTDLEADADEDEEEESDDDEDDSDDEEIDNFNKLLAQTLRTSNPLIDVNGKEDDSSDDEADMDDDAMEALDPHLTKIFQQRRATAGSSKRKEQKDAKETITNFKNRVLDLLSILTKKQSTNPIVPEILPVLAKLIRTTKAKHLATKANDILGSYIQTCARSKEYPEVTDVEPMWDVLRAIHEEAKQSSTPVHGSACSRASLFVLKVLVLQDPSNFDTGADLYATTLKDWHAGKKGSGLKPQFFTEWITWSFDRKKNK